jgi:hypothetical protein
MPMSPLTAPSAKKGLLLNEFRMSGQQIAIDSCEKSSAYSDAVQEEIKR